MENVGQRSRDKFWKNTVFLSSEKVGTALWWFSSFYKPSWCNCETSIWKAEIKIKEAKNFYRLQRLPLAYCIYANYEQVKFWGKAVI